MVAKLPDVENGKRGRLDIYDTEGACLYVAQAFERIDRTAYVGENAMTSAIGAGVAIAVLSKKDLPAGTGCQ